MWATPEPCKQDFVALRRLNPAGACVPRVLACRFSLARPFFLQLVLELLLVLEEVRLMPDALKVRTPLKGVTRVVIATAECDPFSGSSALGRQVRAMADALRDQGIEVGLILPHYSKKHFPLNNDKLNWREQNLPEIGGLSCRVTNARDERGCLICRVAVGDLFEREEIYGPPYEDNPRRFSLFGRAVMEIARRLAPRPQILHLMDWPLAFAAAWNREVESPLKCVMSLPNLQWQGVYPASSFAGTGLNASWFTPERGEFHGSMHLTKIGIAAADMVTLPGREYCGLCVEPKHGRGLEGFFRTHYLKLQTLWPFLPLGASPKRLGEDAKFPTLHLSMHDMSPRDQEIFAMALPILDHLGFSMKIELGREPHEQVMAHLPKAAEVVGAPRWDVDAPRLWVRPASGALDVLNTVDALRCGWPVMAAGTPPEALAHLGADFQHGAGVVYLPSVEGWIDALWRFREAWTPEKQNAHTEAFRLRLMDAAAEYPRLYSALS